MQMLIHAGVCTEAYMFAGFLVTWHVVILEGFLDIGCRGMYSFQVLSHWHCVWLTHICNFV